MGIRIQSNRILHHISPQPTARPDPDRNMSLSPADTLYIAKRERLTRSWPVVGSVILLLLGSLAAWLWLQKPHLINPWLVFEDLESGILPESTVSVMVAMLPIMVLILFFFALIVVLLMFTAMANERRLIRLLKRREKASRDSE